MQYINFDACGNIRGIKAEIERLIENHYITAEQGTMVDCQKLAEFFASDIGSKLRGDYQVHREFKFSILDEAEAYGNGLEGEKVLLQGVVDCTIVEPDGITILDFKTDRVTEETLEASCRRYTPQIDAYAKAMSRIFSKQVKMKALYYFSLGRFVYL